MKEVLDVETYLKKMKNQKINYDKVLRKMINDWEARNERPKVLLHSCCAPCSTASLEFIAVYADITIFSQIRIFIRKVSICDALMNKKFL